ncbi:EAL and GGDEF domain-containing protein [Sporolactobacillus sp. STSJ-5]|uniref:GGDEF domain-containing protein n=1 Tax=Sporolactobacillus sp. STSJ-5 TaxID=2965076 RepID=UPI002102CF9B|nr:bifunctional diguanylate cyclase/phosphodiesterase [Sporolactobacillus sp. STSJ-5]MCQ2011106.1 EAL and GGDEF domain-containing protein [Sporolactobacillus sp. STSJ-5]
MNNTVVTDLDKIINEQKIKAVFQPIVSLRNGEIHGYEALSRVTYETELANPEKLFLAAAEHNRLHVLDSLCRSTSLRSFYDLCAGSPPIKKLFLNVSPVILQDPRFIQTFSSHSLNSYPFEPSQVVFEVTERSSINHPDQFAVSIQDLKSHHFQVAIDDAGAMYSGLNLITDTHPHYVKLDRRLIENIDLGRINFALVKGLVEFCRISNIHLVAEGIETLSELTSLIDLGVSYGQGFYLQRPSERLMEIDETIKKEIIDHHKMKNNVFGQPNANGYILNICNPTETITMQMKIEHVLEKFKKDGTIPGLCVIDNHRVVGIITRSQLTMQVSGRFGFSLYQNQPISVLMDRDFISVDYRTPINEVSKLAMSRPQDKLYDFIVVTKENRYFGTVTIKNLLLKSTEIEVIKAKYENPLTGLPGNLVIEQKMKQTLEKNETFNVLYIDINHFKEYNDVYGFENGDSIIKLLADILMLYLPRGQFVGHVGGDDFITIMDKGAIDNYCEKVSERFQEKVLYHYNEQDRERGFIITENRLGIVEAFSIVSISIAGTCVPCDHFLNLFELTKKLAKLKKKSKKQKDQHYLYIES